MDKMRRDDMTNKEKFIEVFGLEPDTLFCPIKSCYNCPYYDNGCDEKNRANFYNLKYTLNKKDNK